MGNRLGSLFLIIGWLIASNAAAVAQKPAEKPRVPPGRDPGGVAVAIIGSGIDYTRPEIAARLARDGEGEIIGWDFLDNDRRPYERCSRASVTVCAGHLGGNAQVRIMPLRASLDTPQSMVQAVKAAAQMQAQLVLATLAPLPERFVIEAAQQYPRLFFIGVISDAQPDSRNVVLNTGYLAVPADLQDDRGIRQYAPGIAAEYSRMAALCLASNRNVADCVRTESRTGVDRHLSQFMPGPSPSPKP